MSKKKDILKRLNPEEKELLERLKRLTVTQGLKSESLFSIESPLVYAAFLEELPSLKPELLDSTELENFLNWVRERFLDDKHVKKALKRLIFKLKNKKININLDIETKSEPEPIFHKATQEVAYMMLVVSKEESKVILLGAHIYTNTGLDAGIFSFDNKFQLITFYVEENYSKKHIKKIKDLLGDPFPMVEVPLSYVRTLLEDVYSNKKYDLEIEFEVKHLKQTLKRLEKVAPFSEKHPIYELIPDSEISDEITRSELNTLFSDVLVEWWSFMDKLDEIKSLKEELENKASLLILPETELKRIETEIKDRYKEKIIDPEGLVKKFEDLGYYFYKTDKKELFELCLKMLSILNKKGKGYELVSNYMIDKSLVVFEEALYEDEEDEEDEEKERLIITLDDIIDLDRE